MVHDVATAERDAGHGVGQVPVEAGEEAESVLSGQWQPSAGRRIGHVHRSRLAAEVRPPLDHGDVETALGQFVRGGQPPTRRRAPGPCSPQDPLRAGPFRQGRVGRQAGHQIGQRRTDILIGLPAEVDMVQQTAQFEQCGPLFAGASPRDVSACSRSPG